MTKTYKGKAIYSPSGRANEFSYWACNLYKGCSGCCDYCFLKNGILKHVLGGIKPVLKECFKNEADAIRIFNKELFINLPDLQKNGLFFEFTSDFLPETIDLLLQAIDICLQNCIPVKLLTKQTAWITDEFIAKYKPFKRQMAIGFTLTGFDEREKGCAPNVNRAQAQLVLHQAGFITWASIEPIIEIQKSWSMIWLTKGFTSHYKIGLLSGAKYDKQELNKFVYHVIGLLQPKGTPIYFKDSLLKQAGIERASLPAICVGREYNIFKP